LERRPPSVNRQVADPLAAGADLASLALRDDRCLADGELTLLLVCAHFRRPREYHHQDVPFVVDVLWRTFSRAPAEECGVQLL
jgi:hypothetical protein